MEDIEYDGSLVWQKTTDFALGARGIYAISVTTGTGTTISYPIYDAHGNMISTLSKAGAGYTFTAERPFDAWCVIRLGAQSGDPKGRYCASPGHKQDDESGHVYMRARYYEPGSGRFVSEDPSLQGKNWVVYANNNPVCLRDRSHFQCSGSGGRRFPGLATWAGIGPPFQGTTANRTPSFLAQ